MLEPAALARAVGALRAGRLVVFPTETVFGVGADLMNPAAVELLYEIKRRPRTQPLLAHVSGVAMARPLVADWPARADALAAEHWPGPLSIVLPRSQLVDPIVTGGGDTIGLRCPAHPAALELIVAFGGPIAATSANVHGSEPARTAAGACSIFPKEFVTFVDAPPAPAGTPSTVMILGESPEDDRIVRPGPVTPR